MKPIKRKEIVSVVAEQLNLSTEDVDNIIYYYYKHVTNVLDELEHERVYVYNIGTFKIRFSMLLKKLELYKKIIDNTPTENPSLAQYNNLIFCKDRVTKIEALIEKRKTIYKKMTDLKKKKYEPNTIMESERSDIRRD